VRKIRRLLVNLRRRGGAEDTLDAELRAYVGELTARNVRRGMGAEEARRQALVEAGGGIEQIKEGVRGEWPGHGMETAFRDVQYACRSLLRSPGFAVVVVATLALGIGANLTMFSVMRAVLWRPLPYPEPDRIVVIQVDARRVPNTGATQGEVLDLRERSRSLEQVSVIDSADANLEYGGETEHVVAANVSDDFLPLLGARPALGRALNSRIDAGKDQSLAVLIGDELWRRRFSGDPAIVGKAVRINGVEMQIAGVMAAGFRLFLPPDMNALEQVDIWFPYAIGAVRQYRGISVAARLRAGVTIVQANAELQTLAAQFGREHPDYYSSGAVRFTARGLHEETTREARPALLLLGGAVGFVLLIACVNVAGLMLGRGTARQREFEIRRALGAGRIRIIRLLLTESLVLAATAAAVGLVCARVGLEAIGRLSASHVPLLSRIGMDAPVALFAVLLSVVTTMLFGLLPAWRLAGGANRSGSRRLQRALVVAAVALSIVPLVCGGLMLRSFLNLMHSPLGFEAANVVTARVPVNSRTHPKMEQKWAWLRDVLGRVQALPGVELVSAASPLPLAGQQTRRVGRADLPDAPPILATQQIAAPGYLGVMRTPLREGRDFTADDVVPGRSVTIIDERLAKRLWPEGAIGKRLAVYRTGWRHELEVVGVTAAVRSTRVRDDDVPHFAMPYDDYPGEVSLAIRTRETAGRMAPGIRQAVEAAHGGLAAFEIRAMDDSVADSVGDTRFTLLVLAAFAGASVLLAGVGLYGTLAYLTAQRTREFGIRLALGSGVRAIVAVVMWEGILLSVVGAGLGLAGVAAVTGAMQGLLYGVRPMDGLTLGCVAGLVGIVALGAASVPAWRVTRIDPQVALRNE
jgi:predicted permease